MISFDHAARVPNTREQIQADIKPRGPPVFSRDRSKIAFSEVLKTETGPQESFPPLTIIPPRPRRTAKPTGNHQTARDKTDL